MKKTMISTVWSVNIVLKFQVILRPFSLRYDCRHLQDGHLRTLSSNFYLNIASGFRENVRIAIGFREQVRILNSYSWYHHGFQKRSSLLLLHTISVK